MFKWWDITIYDRTNEIEFSLTKKEKKYHAKINNILQELMLNRNVLISMHCCDEAKHIVFFSENFIYFSDSDSRTPPNLGVSSRTAQIYHLSFHQFRPSLKGCLQILYHDNLGSYMLIRSSYSLLEYTFDILMIHSLFGLC